jgi:Cu(I)/Ag(I) efflux system membrane fusion protein
MTQVSEGELGAVKAGQPATVRPRAHPGQEFHGKVAVVYPHLNKETRTGSIRIELPNPDLALLPDMYTDVEIDTGAGEHARLSVPNSSIIDSGNAQVVLVARGEGRFEPRNVALGLRGQDYTEVTSGIAAGDEVVVAANFLIDAESNLKAALSAFSHVAATPAPAAQPPPSAAAPEHSHGSHP